MSPVGRSQLIVAGACKGRRVLVENPIPFPWRQQKGCFWPGHLCGSVEGQAGMTLGSGEATEIWGRQMGGAMWAGKQHRSGASSGPVWLRQGEWLSWDYQPFPTQPWACIMLRKACFCLHIGCSFLCRQCPLLICFPSDIGIKGWAGRYAVCICIDFFLVALLVPVDTNPTQTGWNNTNWNKQNCWLM